MYKLIYNLLTDPLGLPIPLIYEYIIIYVIDKIAYLVAWEVSPGGKLGSEIHWTVRLIFFFISWFIIYKLIQLGKFIYNNPLIVSIVIGSILFLFLTIKFSILFIRYRRKKKTEKKELQI